ncbi:MAG: FAD-dependent monooxygenase [Vicinamibacteria bacterium]|nr:FAD-dependent monooxygenase [Vicinamibacteria bacterium]
MSLPLLIVGGGIGGLTLAALLHRRGREFLVLERAPGLAPGGAGLVLQPNAIKALRIGGIDEQVQSRGEAMRRLQVRDHRGRILSTIDASVLLSNFFAGAVGFHRATLHAALLDLIPPSSIRVASTVRGLDQTESSVWVELETGERLEAAGVVGADGLHSVIRRQLRHDGEPRYAGYTSWRGVTSRGSLWPARQMCESWGRGARFGLVAIDGDRLYWFATANAPAGGRDATKAELLRRFGAWHDPIPAVIESTPEEAILHTDISDRDPGQKWGEGRVTLLGDAAHAMTPNLGQGGGQAIEDAVVLDLVLSAEADCARAFRDYESRRLTRTARVVEQSRRFGRLGQIENGMARLARDWAMRMTPLSVTLRSLRWLYDFDI